MQQRVVSFWGAPKTEAKSDETNALGLKTAALKEYINSKVVKTKDSKDKIIITNKCTSALDVGKYQLAVLLEIKIYEALKSKKPDYRQLLEDFFMAYKINEFLEQPDTYKKTSESVESIFTDRTGLTKLNDESRELGFWKYSEIEMGRLYLLFKKMLHQSTSLSKEISLPERLPDYVTTGSIVSSWVGSWAPGCTSNFHPIIKDLYDQCRLKLTEENAKQAKAQMPR